MEYSRKPISEKIIWLSTVGLLSSFLLFDTSSFMSKILIGITALVFVTSIYQDRGHVRIWVGPYHIFVLLFVIFCFCSSFWAVDPHAAFVKGKTIFQILICTTIFGNHYSKYNTTKPLFDAVMWTGILVSAYAIFFYGMDTIKQSISESVRIDNVFANVNSIGMSAAISIVICCFYILFLDSKYLLMVLFLVPPIIIIATSGSRKALVLSCLGILILMLVKYSNKNIIKTGLLWSISIALLLTLFYFISKLPFFSVLNERMAGLIALITGEGKVDHSAWLRMEFIKAGIEDFKNSPILGIGIGNSYIITMRVNGWDSYLHNNFVELLASGGMIGFLLFYAPYMFFIKKTIFNSTKPTENYVLSVILLLLILVMDYGSVSYYSKITYFYFLIFFLELKNRQKIS